MTQETILSVRDLAVHFPVRGSFGRKLGQIHALDGVSFDLQDGEILGLVGESGCGKSTLGKTVMGIQASSAGAIHFRGATLPGNRPNRRANSAAACNMPIKIPVPRWIRAGASAVRWRNPW